MESSNQTPMVDSHQARADQVLAMARRHAAEIRAAAEQEAERLLAEVEREADRRREEWLEHDRREHHRLAINRREIEAALDATGVAVARIRELIATLPASDALPPTNGPDAAVVKMPASRDATGRRNRIMNSVAVGLGVWAVLMSAMLMLLPRTSTDDDTPTPAKAGTQQPPSADAVVTHAEASPPIVPAVVPAVKVARPSVPASDAAGLTVAFVAAGDCWISIATDDGTSSERLLKASERYVVRARDVVSFRAGNAGALSLLINDQPTAPLGREGRVVVRRITRANYRSFL